MRHHGAPTRLLDFTYSFYVALYFAVEETEKADGSCAVWVINGKWAKRKSIFEMESNGKIGAETLRESITEENERDFDRLIFGEPCVKAVCPLNPFRNAGCGLNNLGVGQV